MTAHAGGHGGNTSLSLRVASGHTIAMVGMGAGSNQGTTTASTREMNSGASSYFTRSSLTPRSPRQRSYTENDIGRVQRHVRTFETQAITPSDHRPSQENAPTNNTPSSTLTPCSTGSQRTPTAPEKPSGTESSPKQEFITRMRLEEEEALAKCRMVLGKMKNASIKQKNVNMDIKTGISELDELFDVIGTCRRSWLRWETDSKVDKMRQKTDSANPPSSLSKETVPHAANTPSSGKRTASSPAAPDSNKKSKTKDDWQMVKHHKNRSGRTTECHAATSPSNKPPEARRKENNGEKKNRQAGRAPKAKPEAVLIKPSDGHTYADVLRNLRSQINTEEALKIRGIRKTRNGAILLELNRGEKIVPTLVKSVTKTVQDMAEVSELKPTGTVEIRDLDSLTTQDEVEAAVQKLLKSPSEDMNIRITAPNQRELVRAFITLPLENARKLTDAKNIRIGWVNARIRTYTPAKRCFRCFGFGHTRVNCKGLDRSAMNLCIKCGEPGHKLKDCRNEAKCCLCLEAGFSPSDHIPGAARCRAKTLHSTK